MKMIFLIIGLLIFANSSYSEEYANEEYANEDKTVDTTMEQEKNISENFNPDVNNLMQSNHDVFRNAIHSIRSQPIKNLNLLKKLTTYQDNAIVKSLQSLTSKDFALSRSYGELYKYLQVYNDINIKNMLEERIQRFAINENTKIVSDETFNSIKDVKLSEENNTILNVTFKLHNEKNKTYWYVDHIGKTKRGSYASLNIDKNIINNKHFRYFSKDEFFNDFAIFWQEKINPAEQLEPLNDQEVILSDIVFSNKKSVNKKFALATIKMKYFTHEQHKLGHGWLITSFSHKGFNIENVENEEDISIPLYSHKLKKTNEKIKELQYKP